MTPELRSMRARVAAHARWSKEDRQAYGKRMRDLRLAKIAKQVDPDGTLDPEERAARVKSVLSEQASRAAYAKALKRAAKKASPTVAAVEPAGETTTTQSARTGQEPQ